jgi:hypothetical protein
MRRKWVGRPVYRPRATHGVQRPRSWTPEFSGQYAWKYGRWMLLVNWNRYTGYRPVGAQLDKLGVHTPVLVGSRESRMKKPQVSAVAPEQPPEEYKPYESVTFKKFPRLVAFLADQWYDNGEPRKRGSLWIDSEGSFWKAMIKEPSLFLCARIRAASLEDLLKALETFLGLDSPPWEPDQYALEKTTGKKKK